jgi:hypothetical protein
MPPEAGVKNPLGGELTERGKENALCVVFGISLYYYT